MTRKATSALLVLIGTVLVQVAWIVVVPPFGAIDEIDHSYRAASVARGQWEAGPMVEDGRGQRVVVPASLVAAARAECETHESFGPDNCVGTPAGEGERAVGSGAGSYNPAFYAVAGLPSLVLEGRAALYGMRALCALLCALAIGAAAWCLGRAGTGPAGTVGLLVAMTPVFAYSTTVVAPNGVEMAAGLLLWCALLAVGRTDSRRAETGVLVAAAVGASVLLTTRSLGPLFALLIVVLMVVARGRHLFAVVRRRPVASTAVVLVSAAAGAASAWWILRAKPLGSGDATPLPHVSIGDTWQVVPTGILQAIAAFPFRDQPAPLLVYPVFAAAAITFAVLGVRRARGGAKAALVGVWALSLAVPVVLTLVTIQSSGIIWQGRYGLPLAVGTALLAGTAIGDDERPVRPWLLRVLTLLVGVAGVLSVAGVAVRHQRAGLSVVEPGTTAALLLLGGAVVLAVVGFLAYARAVERQRAD